jgi:hypothetical protein
MAGGFGAVRSVNCDFGRYLSPERLLRVGKQAEAEAIRDEASRAPERHITHEIRLIAAAAGINAPWLK